jgi:N12 class adenine-specific DNA methylase
MPDPQIGVASVEDIPELVDYRAFARSAATAAGVDPDLVHRLIDAESSWNPHAKSPKGAIGLMQLMPDTAAGLGVDPEDPKQNIRGGIGYLASLIEHFGGDTRKAVAAYNAGPDAVARYGGVPPYKETQDYVDKVVGAGIASSEDIPVGAQQGIASVEPIPGFKPPVVAASALPMPETEKVNGVPTWNALRAMLKTDPQNPTISSGPPGLVEAIQSGADDNTLDTLSRFYAAAGQQFKPTPSAIPPPPGELPGQIPSLRDVARSGLHLAEDVASPVTRMVKGAATLSQVPADAETLQPVEGGKQLTGTEAMHAANELVEGFFQVTTPLIGAAAVDNPVPIAKGVLQAWLAQKVGEKAASVVTDSKEGQRLAGNLAALLSGITSVHDLAVGADKATFDIQAGVAAVLKKAGEQGRSAAVALKLNLGTPEQATSLASGGYSQSAPYPGYRGAPFVDEATARASEVPPSASALQLEEEIRAEDRARAEAAAASRAETAAPAPPTSTPLPAEFGPGAFAGPVIPGAQGSRTPEQQALYEKALAKGEQPPENLGASISTEARPRGGEPIAQESFVVNFGDGKTINVGSLDAAVEAHNSARDAFEDHVGPGASDLWPVVTATNQNTWQTYRIHYNGRLEELTRPGIASVEDIPEPVSGTAGVPKGDFKTSPQNENAPFTYNLEGWKHEQITMGASQDEVDEAVKQATEAGIDPTNSDDLNDLEHFMNAVEQDEDTRKEQTDLGHVAHPAILEWAKQQAEPKAALSSEAPPEATTEFKPNHLSATERERWSALIKKDNKGKATDAEKTELDALTKRGTDDAYLAYLESHDDERLRRALAENRSPSNKSRQIGLPSIYKHEQMILYVMRQRGITPEGEPTAATAKPEKKPVTPQLPPAGGGTKYVLPDFASTPGQRKPAKGTLPETTPENIAAVERAVDAATHVSAMQASASEFSPFKELGDTQRYSIKLNLKNASSVPGITKKTHWHIEQVNQEGDVVEVHARTYDIKSGQPVARTASIYRFKVPADFVLHAPGIASVEEIPEGEGNEQRPVAGGGETRPGVATKPTGGARTAGVEGVGGEQPASTETVAPGPEKPASTGKRGTPSRRKPKGAGATTEGAGQEPRGSEGPVDAGNVDTADVADTEEEADAHARGEAPRWFSITAASSLTEGGWTQKLDDNLAALKLLKLLQAEGRPASGEEQAVLARYVGWGHTELASIVDLRGGESLSDPRKKQARQELEQILTKAELKELGESIANAHYSFFELPRAMWALAQRLGFKGGSILEPAVGSGHFLGTMPGELLNQRRTKVHAVDKEPIASGIARQLYQGAYIQTSPLEDAVIPDDYFDLNISNVPFGKIGIFDPRMAGPEHAAVTKSVHNYYFAKALMDARPGGLILFVTSRMTMDSQSDAVRRYIDRRARFVGAIRLSSQAFQKTAGTEVVTDVIVLQKKGPGVAATSEDWLTSNQREDLGKVYDRYENEYTWVNSNEYFVKHPELILGKEDRSGKMNKRANDYNVVGPVTAEMLAAAVARFPADIYKPAKAAPRKVATKQAADTRQGAFVLEGGKLYTFDRGTLTPTNLKGKSLDRAKSFVPLRDAYQAVVDQMVQHAADEDLRAAQATLKKAYDTYVKKHGHLNTRENKRIIDADPNASRVLALENVDILKGAKGKPSTIVVTGLADIFSKRLMNPPTEPSAAGSPADALVQSIAWKGRVDLEYMSGLTGKPAAELTDALEGEVFQDVATKAWVARDEYLSGDVVTKLAQAQAAAKADKAFTGNVTALKAVQPTLITIDDFSGDPAVSRSAPFGATWVPPTMIESFLNANGGSVEVRLVNSKSLVTWYVDGYGSSEFLPPGAGYAEWVQQSLNGELPTIRTRDPVTKSEVIDPAATERYRQSLAQLREQWASWWKGDPDASEQLVNIYNAMFNREVARSFDGSRLVTPNSNPEIVLRDGQKDSVVGAIQRGNTLLAQAVGWGKTYEMVAIAGEWKRLGLSNKPMVVVPNHLTEQWRRAIQSFYPAHRILVPEKGDFETGKRKRLVARIANNDWDVVVLGMSQFLKVAAKLESVRAFIQEQEDQLLQSGAEELGISVEEFSDAVELYGSDDKDERKAGAKVISGRGKPRTAKDIARSILNLRKRLRKRTDQQAKDPINFEDLGVDGLIIDEAHDYKNLYFFTKKNDVVGLKGSDSDRAMDMYLKVRYINQASNNRNVVFATGTPITNTMSELFTMFRYLAQDSLDRLGMGGFDSWANAYAEAVGSMEPAPEGGYKERNRLSQWTNLGELSRMFKRFADVVTTEDILKENARLEALGQPPLLKLPKVKKFTIQLDPHPEFEEFMEDLRDRIALIKKGEPRIIGYNSKEDRNIMDGFLPVTTSASLAAVDMRLVAPNAVDNPHGRIPVAAREILKRYTASADILGTQIVFLDSGVPKKGQIPPLPSEFTDPAPPSEEADDTPDDEDSADIVDREAEAEKEMDGINSLAFDKDLYGELRKLLVAGGVKDHEIAYIHQATNPSEQRRLFDAVNSGKIRVLLASRFKGGTGMNVQKRIVALHHIDVPWRPDQLEQAEGRAVRQGNDNESVDIIRYVTKKSFDEYRWYLLAKKQGFIAGFYRGDVTSMEDVDTTQLDMQTAAALASGDERVMQMLQLERVVRGIAARSENFQRRRTTAEREVKRAEEANKTLERDLTAMRSVAGQLHTWGEKPTVTIAAKIGRYGQGLETDQGRTYDFQSTEDRKALKEALIPFLEQEDYYGRQSPTVATAGPYVIKRNYVTHEQTTEMDENGKQTVIAGRHAAVLTVSLPLPGGNEVIIGSSPEWDADHHPDIIRSLDNRLDPGYADDAIRRYEKYIRENKGSVAAARTVLEKQFEQADELAAKQKELTDLRVALGVEKAQSSAAKKGPEEEEQHEMQVPQAVAAPLQQAGQTLAGAQAAVRATLTAPEVNQPSRLSARMLRQRVAQMIHLIEYAQHALTTYRNKVEKLTVDHDAILDLADAVENPQTGLKVPKDLQGWITVRDEVYTHLKKQIADLGIAKQWHAHYLGHIWETQFKPGKQGVLASIIGRKPLQGPKSFLKQRTVPTMRQGVKRGLVPKTWNLVEIDLYKMEEMAKFIMAHQYLNDLKREGLAKFQTALKKAPKDMTALPDTMGEVWAPPHITVAEAYDKVLMEGLENYVRSLGVKYVRKPMSGKTWGFSGATSGDITMAFGSPEFMLMHELGHTLDALYGLHQLVRQGVKKAMFEGENYRTILNEMRELAKLRYAGLKVDPAYEKYVQKPTERIANLVHAYLHAPELAKKVAPHWFDAFDHLVLSMPELEPLIDLQHMRSLVIGTRETEKALPGPILLGRYYVDPAVARIVKNYLTPGLGANKLWALVRVPANALVQAKLAISAFHAFTITQEAAALEAGRGITDVARGRLSGVTRIARALAEPAAVIRRGRRARWQYLHTMDPMSLAVDSATNLLLAGGGRVKQSREFDNRSMQKFMDHLRRANAQWARKQAGKAGAEYLGAALRILPAAVEAAAWPILGWLVPTAKAGAAESQIRAELAGLKGAPTEQTLLAIASKAVNLTDATLGEVIWDNYFLPRALMSAVHMLIMAPGWRGGSAIILARGLTDPVRRLVPGQREEYEVVVPDTTGPVPPGTPPKVLPAGQVAPQGTKIVKQKERYWSPYTSLMIATVLVQVLVSEIFQQMHGAGHVHSPLDVAFPRDGGKDANGKPTRVRLPGYAGIFYDIVRDMPKSILEYTLGGTAPMPTAVGQLYANETIFGDEIADKTDPWRVQLWDYAKFMKDQFEPISVSSYGRRTGTPSEKAESVLGISPAPARVTRTPLEDYLHGLQPPAHRTKDQAEKAQARRDFKVATRQGDPAAAAEAARAGGLSARSVIVTTRNLLYQGPQQAFQATTLPQAIRAYEIASPEERILIRSLLQRKQATQMGSIPVDQRAAVFARYQKALQLPIGREPTAAAGARGR